MEPPAPESFVASPDPECPLCSGSGAINVVHDPDTNGNDVEDCPRCVLGATVQVAEPIKCSHLRRVNARQMSDPPDMIREHCTACGAEVVSRELDASTPYRGRGALMDVVASWDAESDPDAQTPDELRQALINLHIWSRCDGRQLTSSEFADAALDLLREKGIVR